LPPIKSGHLQRDFLIIAAQCLVSLHGKDWLKTFLLTVKKVQLFAIISLTVKKKTPRPWGRKAAAAIEDKQRSF
jgi:hypothetical protein